MEPTKITQLKRKLIFLTSICWVPCSFSGGVVGCSVLFGVLDAFLHLETPWQVLNTVDVNTPRDEGAPVPFVKARRWAVRIQVTR